MLMVGAVSGWSQDLIIKLREDISVRRLLERHLRDGQASFRAIVDMTIEGILVVDLDGVVRFVNPSMESMLRERSTDLLDTKFGVPLEPDQHTELRIVRSDGETGIGEMRVAGTEWEGRPARLVSVHDITERREFENDLRDAKEAAEAANLAKSQFVANMSHEVRNPMNGILGMTELLLDTGVTAEQQDYIGAVKDSADLLHTVLNDILDISKIEAGKLELEAIEFDLSVWLSDIVTRMGVRASHKGLRPDHHIQSEVPDGLIGDPTRLHQIIANLVSNAIKFTEHGEVGVRVERETETEDEVVLHFTVSDTGIGIPEEKRQLVFAAFAQADSSTTRQYGGTGLGLAICSQLVAMMGGKIWVDSRAGVGSTFHFTALFGKLETQVGVAHRRDVGAKSQSLKALDERRQGSARVPPAGTSSGARILVAEDNAVNRKVAAGILEKHGYDVMLARTGKECLGLFTGEPFDLIVMDVQMPEMDGLEATAATREMERRTGAHIPIVAMTAHAMKGDKERFLQAGIDAYVSKPVQAQYLLDTIEELVFPSHQEEKQTPVSPIWSPGFDLDVALAHVDGDTGLLDTGLLKEVAEMFCQDTPSMLEEIRNSIATADTKGLEHSAHALKGAVGNFGAQVAWDYALKLELMGRDGEISHAQDVFDQLHEQIDRIRDAVGHGKVGLAV